MRDVCMPSVRAIPCGVGAQVDPCSQAWRVPDSSLVASSVARSPARMRVSQLCTTSICEAILAAEGE